MSNTAPSPPPEYIYKILPSSPAPPGLKLGRDEVESVGLWKKNGGIWSPDGWLFGEDIPRE
ncbi:hypothetical protein BUE80_DR004227 [Diplocarpon rosae]|nr:hypothetical protein BUE80_DR004227 [Diplocarpon rosae]